VQKAGPKPLWPPARARFADRSPAVARWRRRYVSSAIAYGGVVATLASQDHGGSPATHSRGGRLEAYDCQFLPRR